ncbi:hypothetical protein L798_11114 [Zootermopsis nevadensis]|uniref:Uncharacterized protein n=1 Tax=Zootermopsis nevadensis TaxID=136037 RepID=A0A067R6C8_ZOONE|nr:hypothetical protein L798_11114 [Zootermopsis nevadensis]
MMRVLTNRNTRSVHHSMYLLTCSGLKDLQVMRDFTQNLIYNPTFVGNSPPLAARMSATCSGVKITFAPPRKTNAYLLTFSSPGTTTSLAGARFNCCCVSLGALSGPLL